MDHDGTTLGERIRAAREARWLNQKELSELVGVNRVTVTNWESGRREPDLSTIIQLAALLETTVAYLCGEVDDPRPNREPVLRADYPHRPPEWYKLTPEQRKEAERQTRAYEEFIIERLLREKKRPTRGRGKKGDAEA